LEGRRSSISAEGIKATGSTKPRKVKLRLTVILELVNGPRGLPSKEVYGILIAEPIGSFDGVVHVVEPVVLGIAGGVYATLGSDSVRARGEELRDDGHPEAFAAKAEGCPQTCAARPHHHYVVDVIHQGVNLSRNGRTSTRLCKGINRH
jgi:hypothetical protein